MTLRTRMRARGSHGILLMEVIVAVILVFVMVGALAGGALKFQNTLAMRAKMEAQGAEWNRLSGLLRDDLRSAVRIAYQPADNVQLRIQDGSASIEYSTDGRELIRTRRATGKRDEQQRFKLPLNALSVQHSGAKATDPAAMWKLDTAKPGDERLLSDGAFCLVTLEMTRVDGSRAVKHVGAAARRETP